MQNITKRHNYILEKLARFGSVRIADIAEELGVTTVTIRNDLNILEADGLVYRIHGGARQANPHVTDMKVTVKDNINREAKRNIAQRAATLIEDNDSIIIGDGSTVYAFAEEIKTRSLQHLNIVTPFLRIGLLFNDMDNVNVVQLGGTVHRESLSVLGEDASRALEDCVCSKVFLGADGIDIENGLTTSTIEGAKLLRKMIRTASKTIVLADSTKFGQRGFGHICDIGDIDTIITNDEVSEEVATALEEAGVKLIVATRPDF